MYVKNKLNGESFNFGPMSQYSHTVENILKDLSQHWNIQDPSKVYTITDNIKFHEAGLLKLNCDKALHSFGWQTTLNFKETAKWTVEWYKTFYEDGPEAANLKTQNQKNN